MLHRWIESGLIVHTSRMRVLCRSFCMQYTVRVSNMLTIAWNTNKKTIWNWVNSTIARDTSAFNPYSYAFSIDRSSSAPNCDFHSQSHWTQLASLAMCIQRTTSVIIGAACRIRQHALRIIQPFDDIQFCVSYSYLWFYIALSMNIIQSSKEVTIERGLQHFFGMLLLQLRC